MREANVPQDADLRTDPDPRELHPLLLEPATDLARWPLDGRPVVDAAAHQQPADVRGHDLSTEPVCRLDRPLEGLLAVGDPSTATTRRSTNPDGDLMP